MIRFKDVVKIYPNGFSAIKSLNLSVSKGDIAGIIGYSGAGKSTLIRLINSLESPSRGNIYVDNIDITTLGEYELQKTRQNIGMIFQNFNLLSSRNVFGNISFALEIAGWKKQNIATRVEELLELVGLGDKAKFYPEQLSGGQKQRVAIARALANYPKILLCDEATSALDTKTTRSILELLANIHQKLGLTIVFITHQIEVVRQICNKMYVMSNGEIVEEGDVVNIFASPKHVVTRELLSFLPVVPLEETLTQNRNNDEEIYKISFVGKHIHEPLISEVISKFKIKMNILAGNISTLPDTEVGHLFIALNKHEANKEEAIKYLMQKQLIVEIV
ncbi:ATP-binding cassette domain-containing protein [Helicobacter muridarum]|uniref:Cell division ATP-binding protein FtsE n=1 Tax=Helicobacter muridarum TaxID=216 RepID=A0A099U0V3_9HELI|nr:ATP-binding cassette domain-containing protein [Helicobacter muridarum]TLE01385.1 ATP-binding cassette domain-containing protein [Helicobacter muridarum]STQ85313.1 ABC transporter ATP-binding protein [Helicobacter muridarum]